jgi:regulator of sigma E protease
MNILPIPALDGGHIMFLLIEGVMRREPSLRVRMVAQQIGMVLLLSLMVFIIFNDIIGAIG